MRKYGVFFLLITNLSKLFFFKLTTHYQTKVNHCLFKPPLFLFDTLYIGILQLLIVLYRIERNGNLHLHLTVISYSVINNVF